MPAKILLPSQANITKLAKALNKGELVGVPTETVYGLGANALDARACRKIFTAKGRPANDPLIVHVLGWNQALEIADGNSAAEKLAQAFWPGPLTIILPKKKNVPNIVTAGLDSVAVRAPNHPAFRKLIKAAALPVAAPSANPFGYLSPTTAKHVAENLGNKIPFILDGGACRVGVESTIVDMRNPVKPVILRPGAISAKDIALILHCGVKETKSSKTPVAPGQLPHHYSPRTLLKIHDRIPFSRATRGPESEAWIYFHAKPAGARDNIFSLEAYGQPERAAQNLFSVLREVDQRQFAKIHIELAPSGGIGDAINDRLRRAAAKR